MSYWDSCMPKTQTIHALFGDKHKEYIKAATRCTMSVAEGAVRAGKTIDNIAAFAWMIDHGTPDRIHLVTGSTVGTAKLNIGDANGFGLEYIFRGRCKWTKYKDNEALIIESRGREYVVIFAGGAKADSYKRIRGNSYGMWLATEINLHHRNTIEEAFNRQLAARVRRIFWDLNPINPGAWIYKDYINLFSERFPGEYNYQHFTIFDNATITEKRLEEIKRQYIPGTVWYRRDILGERCIAEGLVYPMYQDALEDTYTGEVTDYRLSIDYGTMNAFAALKWVRSSDGVWRIVDEYYYSGRDEGRQKTDADYVHDLEAFTADAPQDVRVYVDPSATSFKTALRRANGRNFKITDADNDVLPGIEETATCMQSEQGLIKIGRNCVHTIEELGGYVWDDKNDYDKPVKENDHCLTGDTLIDTESGQVPIKDLVGASGKVWSVKDGKAVLMPYHDVRMTQEAAQIYEIETMDGRTIKCTAEHPILTERGWIQCQYLSPSDKIVTI